MNNRSLSFLKYSSAALILCVSTGFAAAQDVAVNISTADIAALEAGCSAGPACDLAIKALVARLAAANPGVPMSRIVGSVVSAVSADYNAGRISPAVAREFFASATREASARGLTTLSRALTVASASIARGDAISLEAVAESAASPS
ncbi:hypothetical protein ACEN2J_14285 [Pseudorhodobacter sp. W20_MBD10_FR17]|uniref:hypothetical protein n=1 Tax=Pseudorhodobacter sp. W20_MBD10_FR17 TaxID=3240266 RepID=UPI003F94C8AC